MTSCRIDQAPGGHGVKNAQTEPAESLLACETFSSLLNHGCWSVMYSRVSSEFICSCEGNKSVIPKPGPTVSSLVYWGKKLDLAFTSRISSDHSGTEMAFFRQTNQEKMFFVPDLSVLQWNTAERSCHPPQCKQSTVAKSQDFFGVLFVIRSVESLALCWKCPVGASQETGPLPL